MGYDLYPKDVATLKKKMLDQAVREEWLVCLDHDPDSAMIRLTAGERGPKVVPIEPVAS